MANSLRQPVSVFGCTPQPRLFGVAVLVFCTITACSLPAWPPGGATGTGTGIGTGAKTGADSGVRDASAITADGPAATPDVPAVTSDGPVVTPDGLAPDLPAVTPDGPAAKLDGPAATPDVPIVIPDGPAVIPDGPVVLPDVIPGGPTAIPDSRVVTPDGPTVIPDGPTLIPDGPTAAPDASLAATADAGPEPDAGYAPDAVLDVGPLRPANLSIKRESDTTRQVRLSWEYPSAVDIYIHNGDANGYYVESFSGATVVSNITSGTWLDTDAPSYSARYYRVRALDTGQFGIDTLVKQDLSFPGANQVLYGIGLLPSTSDINAFLGSQASCPNADGWMMFKKFTALGWNYDMATYSCASNQWRSGTSPDQLPSVSVLNSDALLSEGCNLCTGNFTITGSISAQQPQISIPTNLVGSETPFRVQFSTGLPVPIDVKDLIAPLATPGTSDTTATTILFPQYTGGGNWSTTSCWFQSDGHWYTTGGVNCDDWVLGPYLGFWLSEPVGGGGYTLTIPKPYSNP
jgi:hypothetical protein